MNEEYILEAKNIHKSFKQGISDLHILKGINLKVKKGDSLCILGSSGAGKSTLLQILGSLDKPTEGRVYFEGKNIFDWNDEKISKFRGQSVGFVFQFHHLLGEFTALENVMMPARIAGDSVAKGA